MSTEWSIQLLNYLIMEIDIITHDDDDTVFWGLNVPITPTPF
jgi:hypothetical protein